MVVFPEFNKSLGGKRKIVIFAFQKQICLLVLPATKFSKTGRLDLLLLQFAYYLSTLKNRFMEAERISVQESNQRHLHIPADTRSAFPLISVHSPVSIQYRWQS